MSCSSSPADKPQRYIFRLFADGISGVPRIKGAEYESYSFLKCVLTSKYRELELYESIYAFSYYYENIADYSYLYGSLSVMVFFMLWLFVCIYMLFIGAEINKSIEKIKKIA